MIAAEIISALEEAKSLPTQALRRAVRHASEVGPTVVEVIESAAEGTYLTLPQERLLFWGIHALAAARREELYRPLMQLLRNSPERDLERLLGDAATETLGRIVLSVFDGDAVPLVEAIADKNVEGFARWGLLDVLARLTVDGAIPRETTLAVLDRFEWEPLAGPGDPAWEGWQDAMALLRIENAAERVRATWQDGRNPQREPDQRAWEEELTATDREGDFDGRKLVPIDDPVEALSWLREADKSRKENSPAKKRLGPDPALSTRLDEDEIDWLAGFLESAKCPPGTMMIEELDGFLTALVVGPDLVPPSEYLPEVWGGDTPVYDTVEQAEYVMGLLMRHWNTIARRLDKGYPHIPLIARGSDEPEAMNWALGFRHGTAMRATSWDQSFEDEQLSGLLAPIVALGLDEATAQKEGINVQRSELVGTLPLAILGIHLFWREHASKARFGGVGHRKAGRNEPCPCGSGRKYKHCCGSGSKPKLH